MVPLHVCAFQLRPEALALCRLRQTTGRAMNMCGSLTLCRWHLYPQ